MSVRVVVELHDGLADDEKHDRFRLDMLKAIVAAGGWPPGSGILDLGDGTNIIGAKVVGVLREVNAPTPAKRYRVEDL